MGALRVDHSPTMSGPGEEFRSCANVLHEMTVALTEAIEAKKGTGKAADPDAVWAGLARRYWAEAEALELSRSTPAMLSHGNGSQRL